MEIKDDLDDYEIFQKPQRKKVIENNDKSINQSKVNTTLNMNTINEDKNDQINNEHVNEQSLETMKQNHQIININTGTNDNQVLPKRKKKLNPVMTNKIGMPRRKAKNVIDMNKENGVINSNIKDNYFETSINFKKDFYELNNNLPEEENVFHLNVQGIIESGIFYGGNKIFCKYDICFGGDWKIISGQTTGLTQHACEGEGTSSFFVWNMPFELSLKSSEPIGWPQLILSFFFPDDYGREVVKGYGICTFPTFPGSQRRKLHIFSPLSSEEFSYLNENLFGEKVELINPIKVFSSGEGREILRTQSEGEVEVMFNTQINGIEEFGFD